MEDKNRPVGPRRTAAANDNGPAGSKIDVEVVRIARLLGRQEGGSFGPETCAFLRRYNAGKAFIGASGLTVEGPAEANPAATWVKRSMIERSDRTLLLVDRTKFGARSLELICPLEALDDLVADGAPDTELGNALAAARVALRLAT